MTQDSFGLIKVKANERRTRAAALVAEDTCPLPSVFLTLLRSLFDHVFPRSHHTPLCIQFQANVFSSFLIFNIIFTFSYSFYYEG